MRRVIIIGAGVTGCASAFRLARLGLEVEVLDQSRLGVEAATHAAAGIIGAQVEIHSHEAMRRLCVASRALYSAWVAELAEETGLDVRICSKGALRVALDAAGVEDLAKELAEHHAADLEAELLSGDEARLLEPALSDAVQGALFFPRDGAIDPRQLLTAVQRAAEQAGARFRWDSRVARVARSSDDATKLTGVQLENGEVLAADAVVLAAGGWSNLVEHTGLAPELVRPIRGQMLQLGLSDQVQRHVVDGPGAYLSPRADGRVLVGSTVEDVGFERGVTDDARQALRDAAAAMVPALAEASLSDHWCGFRANTPDGLPVFGTGYLEGLVLATGHYRNGVLLAPISATIVSALVCGETPPIDISPFDVRRF